MSKHPEAFYHEEPQVRNLKQKVDDLEDLEARADMVANHMSEKFPSMFAGDTPSQRDDVSTMPEKYRQAKEQKEDENFFSLLKPHKPAISRAKTGSGIIEQRSSREFSRKLKLEEQVKSSAAKSIANSIARSPEGNR